MPTHDTGSVRSKLIIMAVSTTFVALLSAAIAMLLYDLRTFQQYWVDDLTTQADIIASVTAPALAFNDAKTAQQNLAVLRVRPQILSGAIYSSAGTRFASYAQQQSADQGFPDKPGKPGYRIDRGELVVVHNIVENGELVGSVYLRSRYGLVERLINYATILGAVMRAGDRRAGRFAPPGGPYAAAAGGDERGARSDAAARLYLARAGQ
jgi:hypothetical protein